MRKTEDEGVLGGSPSKQKAAAALRGQSDIKLKHQPDITIWDRTDDVIPGDLGKLRFEKTHQPRLIQIVERRRFGFECLALWLNHCVPEFEVLTDGPPADADDKFIARVAVVMVAGDTLARAPEYFESNVAWLGPCRQNIPLVALLTDDLLDQTEHWIERFGLSGCIQESSSTEIGAAILRLVAAGGTHFPRSTLTTSPITHLNRSWDHTDHASMVKLTLRERAVVYYLGQGYSNKTIARELNLSLSTVKAHMHNIIQKLNVRNRTEVAMLSGSIVS